MSRTYFLKTERIGFSKWRPDDLPLAEMLWGNPLVTRYICATGIFSPRDVASRLQTELEIEAQLGIQYWPIFELTSGELIGCCGLRPHREKQYELGFHLRPEFWGSGLAAEAAGAAIAYAFAVLQADSLFAGHNPHNVNSATVLKKLGFSYTGEEFYGPTGLNHPSYLLKKPLQYRFAGDTLAELAQE